jgi:hypothetical protein
MKNIVHTEQPMTFARLDGASLNFWSFRNCCG